MTSLCLRASLTSISCPASQNLKSDLHTHAHRHIYSAHNPTTKQNCLLQLFQSAYLCILPVFEPKFLPFFGQDIPYIIYIKWYYSDIIQVGVYSNVSTNTKFYKSFKILEMHTISLKKINWLQSVVYNHSLGFPLFLSNNDKLYIIMSQIRYHKVLGCAEYWLFHQKLSITNSGQCRHKLKQYSKDIW